MATVLVTGGAGYIGSHACKVLAGAGHLPVAFDNLSTGQSVAVKFGPLVQGDLLDQAALRQAFTEHQPDAVMHFAAFSDVGESVKKPSKYWKNNILGSLNLLEEMVEADCKKIVFSSTCAIYGDQDRTVLDETSPRHPVNAYGASKRAVEDMLENYDQAHGIKNVTFRYFNVAGADPEGEIGEWHRPETHLVPLMLMAVKGEHGTLTVHGTDYDTPDGTCIRDYVHVMDLVDAHLLGLRWLTDGKPSRDFNLGTGKGFSVREVIDASRAVTNRTVPMTDGPRRAGDVVRLVSGIQRAQDELGWRPTRSTMPEMIRDAWAWHTSGGFDKA